MIIYNKISQLFFDFVVRQTFLGFEMTANFRDTSPLNLLSPVFADRFAEVDKMVEISQAVV